MSYPQSSNFPLVLFACQNQYLSGVCFWGPANQLHCADTAQFMLNWAAAFIPIKGTKHTIIPDMASHCYSKHHCDLKITDCQRMEGAWRQPHPSPAFSWRGNRRGAITSELAKSLDPPPLSESQPCSIYTLLRNATTSVFKIPLHLITLLYTLPLIFDSIKYDLLVMCFQEPKTGERKRMDSGNRLMESQNSHPKPSFDGWWGKKKMVSLKPRPPTISRSRHSGHYFGSTASSELIAYVGAILYYQNTFSIKSFWSRIPKVQVYIFPGPVTYFSLCSSPQLSTGNKEPR